MDDNPRHRASSAEIAQAASTVLGIEHDTPPPSEVQVINANMTVVCLTSGALYRLASSRADSHGQYHLRSLDYSTTRLVSQAELEEDYRMIGASSQ